jgi:hypothetical protein
MSVQQATIPPEIIRCIAHGREPDMSEMRSVADQIWRDIVGATSNASLDPKARQLSLRAARAALAGGH